MFRSIILCLMLLCLCGVATITLAQPPDTLWTRVFGGNWGDDAYFVRQTSDGGFVLTGMWRTDNDIVNTYLMKVDPQGNQVWLRQFDLGLNERGNCVAQTYDGGYVITGEVGYQADNQDIFLIKTDSLGNFSWVRTYGGNNDEWGKQLQITSDGGYVIGGTTKSFGAGQEDMYLIKTDENGDTLWTRTFGTNGNEEGNSVWQNSDGGYYIAGNKYVYNSSWQMQSDYYVVRTNASGILINQTAYPAVHDDWCYSVQQTTDGGYMLAGIGTSFPYGYDVYLIKAGATSWTKIFNGGDTDCCYHAEQTSDGGFICVGSSVSWSPQYADVYLFKTNASGDQVWQCTFGGGYIDVGRCVQQTSDGGYILAGIWWSGDIYLIKTTAGGGPLSLQTTPVHPPIIIPANGGSFQYNLSVNNWTIQNQNITIWGKIRTEQGTYFPAFGPVTRNLSPSANISRTLTQTVASTVPAGENTYITYFGTYPNDIVDSSFFPITKTALSDGGPWITKSSCTGDCFDEYAPQDNPSVIPNSSFVIRNCSPNPFNPTTTIRFDLQQAARVSLEVFDINGRVVGVQHVEPLQAGSHEIVFDGSGLPSGVYLYRLTAGGQSASGKMVLMK